MRKLGEAIEHAVGLPENHTVPAAPASRASGAAGAAPPEWATPEHYPGKQPGWVGARSKDV